MKIGLLDVDGHNFPNLPLMKISAYHKARGDSVELWTHKHIKALKKIADKAVNKEDKNQLKFDDRKHYDERAAKCTVFAALGE